MGAVVKFVPVGCKRWYQRTWKGQDPDKNRPFYQIELERAKQREKEELQWEEAAELERDCARGRAAQGLKRSSAKNYVEDPEKDDNTVEHSPTRRSSNTKVNTPMKEGGRDKLIPDIGYYARRVGLDVEEYKVETEDGFIISLQRVFDPEDPPADAIVVEDGYGNPIKWGKKGRRKYPLLLMHGLLQSSGAFCVNDDDSLAFFLCKR